MPPAVNDHRHHEAPNRFRANSPRVAGAGAARPPSSRAGAAPGSVSTIEWTPSAPSPTSRFNPPPNFAIGDANATCPHRPPWWNRCQCLLPLVSLPNASPAFRPAAAPALSCLSRPCMPAGRRHKISSAVRLTTLVMYGPPLRIGRRRNGGRGPELARVRHPPGDGCRSLDSAEPSRVIQASSRPS